MDEQTVRRRLERLEAVQETVLEIDRLQSSCHDIPVFLGAIHGEVAKLMYAVNFFVALYDTERNAYRMAYHVDEVDELIPPDLWFPLTDPTLSPTCWVILNRKPLVMTAEEDAAMEATLDGRSFGIGARAEHWVGMPMLHHDGTSIGALVIQSYDPNHTYSDEDQALFQFIANHVATSIARLQTVMWLEASVRDRTALLESEVAERKRAEALQRALYEIAALSAEAGSESLHYERLHGIFKRLMYAHNFIVALYDPRIEEVCLAYFVDEKDTHIKNGTTFPLGKGFSSLVLTTRQPWLLDPMRTQWMQARGELPPTFGNQEFSSWMGVPMIVEDRLYGMLVVQSYDPAIIYNDDDLELLNFVGNHVAAVVARWAADRELAAAREGLEERNAELTHALANLQLAQAELVRQEKLASLGSLVAGIAHEINTPLGICVTATSHMAEELRITEAELNENKLTEAILRQFFGSATEAVRILASNTQRAASLVRSFKQVAVDQSSDEMRQFNLSTYIDEILLSMRPKMKGTGHSVAINCPSELIMFNHPGALSQVLSNLVMNSLIHGFDGMANGKIEIDATCVDEDIVLIYRDNGCGMDEDALEKLFDPFYTTRRGQGGSGLGAHIVYNLVTGALGGKLKVSSHPGAGLVYTMRMPRNRPQTPALLRAGHEPDGQNT